MIHESFTVAASRYSTHAAVSMVTEEADKDVDDFEGFIYAKRQKTTNVDGETVKYLGTTCPLGMRILWDIGTGDRWIS